jgi:hypothetical protein
MVLPDKDLVGVPCVCYGSNVLIRKEQGEGITST